MTPGRVSALGRGHIESAKKTRTPSPGLRGGRGSWPRRQLKSPFCLLSPDAGDTVCLFGPAALHQGGRAGPLQRPEEPPLPPECEAAGRSVYAQGALGPLPARPRAAGLGSLDAQFGSCPSGTELPAVSGAQHVWAGPGPGPEGSHTPVFHSRLASLSVHPDLCWEVSVPEMFREAMGRSGKSSGLGSMFRSWPCPSLSV